MNPKIQLMKNTFILLIGKVFTQGISFLLLPLYTSYLIASEYGYYDLINTYVMLLVPVVLLQLDQAVFRFLAEHREDKSISDNIIKESLLLIVKLLLCFSVIYFFINLFFDIPFYLLIFFTVVVHALYSYFIQVIRGYGYIKFYSLVNFIFGVLNISLNILFVVVMNLGISSLFLSFIFSCFIVSLLIFIKLNIFKILVTKSSSDMKFIKMMIKYSLPLIPESISWWVVSISDRSIISVFISVAANGIYAISNKFSVIINVLLNVYSTSWRESVIDNINEEKRDKFLSDIFNVSVVLFSTCMLFIIAFLAIIFPYFIDYSYRESYYYIPILSLASLLNVFNSLYAGIYIAKKDSKNLAFTTILAAVINVVINLIFITKLGLYAACFSTLISYFILMIYRALYIKKYVSIKYNFKNILFLFIAFFVVFITYYINNFYLNFISLIFSLFVAVLFNKQIICKSFVIFLNKIRK